MPRSDLLGAWGEATAGEYLRRKRYKLLAINYRCRMGEIDLIAANRRYIVFVEVKLRGSATFAQAREFVDVHKQRRIVQTAKLYLSRYPTKLQPRFDVIEIYAPQGLETHDPIINHLEDAFSEHTCI